MLVGTQMDDELPDAPLWQSSDRKSDWNELISTVRFIQSRYGDTLDTDSIVEQTIQYLVDKLDPHSYYLSGVDYQRFKERLTGGYEGIGVEYQVLDDSVVLSWIYPNGPAAEAGLKQGDVVLAIDQVVISGQNLTDKDVWQAWKDTGRSFALTFLSRSESSVKDAVLTKGDIELRSVPVAQLFDQVGYLKILRFNKGTYSEFMEGLEVLVEDGAKDLIIDVRDNPGGSLHEVVKILDQLVLDKDQLLLYMQGAQTKRTEHRSTGRVFFPMERIVVLINEHSVSASEVLAGVLQDLGRAKVAGRRSFGKALVQEMYTLDDYAALNLSIGKYYLPGGRYIQRSYRDRDGYLDELEARVRSGELFESDSLKPDEQPQGPSVDGVKRPIGQGIYPDLFVPANPLAYSAHWKQIKVPFSKATFSWFTDLKLDSTQLDQVMSLDSILDTHVYGYLPSVDSIPDTQPWKNFLKDEARLHFLAYLGKEGAIAKYGNHLDPVLAEALKYLQQDLGAQKNQF